MYTVIRRYEGVLDTAEVARRSIDEFAPRLRDRPGFQGYWVVDEGDGVLATISVFETEEEAVNTTQAAIDWHQESGVGDLLPNPPQVTAGATIGVMAEVTV